MTEALIVGPDLLARERVVSAAQAAGYRPVTATALVEPPVEPPTVLVIDLDTLEDWEALARWRATFPGLRMIAFVSHIAGDRRKRAEALACEVYPRGATAKDFVRVLAGD